MIEGAQPLNIENSDNPKTPVLKKAAAFRQSLSRRLPSTARQWRQTMIAVRKASQSDRQAVWSVHVRAIRETCSRSYTPEQVIAWSRLLPPDSSIQVLQDREFLVAEKHGVIAGFGLLNQGSEEVEAVYVRPDHLRGGVGRAILEALERVAQQGGLDTLWLFATLNAVPFYLAAGYIVQHDTQHCLPNGMELPCVRMAKRLPSESRAAQPRQAPDRGKGAAAGNTYVVTSDR